MKLTHRWIAAAAALILTVSTLPAFAAEEEEEAMSVQEAAEYLLSSTGMTSLQYALWDNGEVTQSGHAGIYSRTENRALTNQDLYGIGSVSKLYTTAAVLRLAEEGKLNLDQPVAGLLPGFTMRDPRYRQITVRMLLNHSSGLYGSSFQNTMLFNDNDTDSHDRLLEKLAQQTLKADPGAFSVYCNDGFSLAELVVEQVSGMSFTQYLHQTFFGPLELKNTVTTQDSFDPNRLVRAYSPLFQQEMPTDRVNVIGAGGLYATAEDVSVFGGLLTGAKPDILSEASALAMQEPEYRKGLWPEVEENTIGYGLGWDSVDRAPLNQIAGPALEKGGDSLFFHASLLVLPQYGLSAAVLSSGGSSSVDAMLAQRIVQEALREKGIGTELPALELIPAVKADMPEEYEQYSGVYGATGANTKVIVKDGELRVPMSEDPADDQVFLYTGDGKFSTAGGEAVLSFVTAENGNTYLQMTAAAQMGQFGSTRTSYFDSQKLAENPLPEQVKAAWDARDGKRYYAVNEKATSEPVMMMPSFQINADTAFGYSNGCKIIDESTAVNVLQIPVTNGRDSFDLRFWEEEGAEYLSKQDSVYISEDAIPAIWGGSESTCTIQPSGRIRWYRSGDEASEKTMTVSVPEGGSFLVLTATGQCAEYSTVSGNRSAAVPEGGMLAFLGEPGDIFQIKME